jgi:hypothetical protein
VKIAISKSPLRGSVASGQSTVASSQWSGKKEEVRVGLDGVHVKDGNEETHVTWDGVYHSDGKEVTKVIWGKDSTKNKRPNLYSRRGLGFSLGLNALSGQLTGSIFYSKPSDLLKECIETLSRKAGRIILNDVPTGVRVTQSMHHGGPFPASSDSRFTAVGTDSMKRFQKYESIQQKNKT